MRSFFASSPVIAAVQLRWVCLSTCPALRLTLGAASSRLPTPVALIANAAIVTHPLSAHWSPTPAVFVSRGAEATGSSKGLTSSRGIDECRPLWCAYAT